MLTDTSFWINLLRERQQNRPGAATLSWCKTAHPLYPSLLSRGVSLQSA
jgi:hypothetical protein